MAGGIAFGLGAVMVVRSLIRRLERELGGVARLSEAPAAAAGHARAGGS
jgi:hypothetical protein